MGYNSMHMQPNIGMGVNSVYPGMAMGVNSMQTIPVQQTFGATSTMPMYNTGSLVGHSTTQHVTAPQVATHTPFMTQCQGQTIEKPVYIDKPVYIENRVKEFHTQVHEKPVYM